MSKDAVGKNWFNLELQNGVRYSNPAGTPIPDVTAPSVPVLTATAVSSSQIDISWTASTDDYGVTGYTLQRSLDNVTWTTLKDSLSLSHVESGRPASTLHYYRVRSYDGSGNQSAWATAQARTHSGSWIFTDDFASGDRSKTQNGFYWFGNTSNCTVVQDPGNPSGYALRFRFDQSTTTAVRSEQRFYLGPAASAGAYKDLWFRWRMLIPSNYLHGPNEPSNNKWLRVWHGDTTDGNNGYSNYYVKGGFSTRRLGSYSSQNAERGATGSGGVGNFGLAGVDFINAADLGQEMDMVLRVKLDDAGTPGDGLYYPTYTGNGIMQVWKNGVKIMDYQNLPWRASDGIGEFFEYGYVLGAANAGWYEQTDILLREFSVATANIFGVS